MAWVREVPGDVPAGVAAGHDGVLEEQILRQRSPVRAGRRENSDVSGSSAWPPGTGAGSVAVSAGWLESSPGCAGVPASSIGRGPRPRPRPPRRPRRRLLGRRAEGGRFKLDCSSGTILFRNSMAAWRANAKPNPPHFLVNKARAAVWLCKKFVSPMGPISPLQKKPASPSGPKWSCTSPAS